VGAAWFCKARARWQSRSTLPFGGDLVEADPSVLWPFTSTSLMVPSTQNCLNRAAPWHNRGSSIDRWHHVLPCPWKHILPCFFFLFVVNMSFTLLGSWYLASELILSLSTSVCLCIHTQTHTHIKIYLEPPAGHPCRPAYAVRRAASIICTNTA
jgi:hypothetical protein